MPNIEYLLPNIGRTAAPGDAPGEELRPTQGPPPICALSVPPLAASVTAALCMWSPMSLQPPCWDTRGSHPALCNPPPPPRWLLIPTTPLGGTQPAAHPPHLHLSRCQPGDLETSMLD